MLGPPQKPLQSCPMASMALRPAGTGTLEGQGGVRHKGRPGLRVRGPHESGGQAVAEAPSQQAP